jgi:integrase/recombinase XerD
MREPWVVTREMFLSWDDQNRLLAFLERSEGKEGAGIDALMVRALLFSGLKTSEFCRLRVGDFVHTKRESAFVVTGTPREDRKVYIPRVLGIEIDQYRRKVRPGMLHESLKQRDESEPMFVNDRGRGFDRTTLYRRVVRVLQEAGLGERASVQLLRHTYGFRAYCLSGGNLLFVQRQMGHAHPMVTSVYAEFANEDYQGITEGLIETGG